MKHVLITGVSRGLGLEIAKIFLENGWYTWGISRSSSPELIELLNSYPNRFKWKAFDLVKTDKISESLFKEFVDYKIPLSAVINNAAIAYDDIVTNININSLENMFKINVYSPMLISKFAIRNMLLNQTNGSIIHISSICVHAGYKGLSMYAATKGALEAFSKNTAREWGTKNIRSNCIVAGFMKTTMSSSLNSEQIKNIFKRTSLKRETCINSVAEITYYLCTGKAESITGQNIFVDSGTI